VPLLVNVGVRLLALMLTFVVGDMVAAGRQAVVAGHPAVGAVGQRDGANKLVGCGYVQIAGGGAGDVQCLGADQSAQGHKACQIGRCVVGLAASQRQCCGADGDGIAATGAGDGGQRVVGRRARAVGQSDGVDVFAWCRHILAAGRGAGVGQCFLRPRRW
jgi:hypothetical protein